MRYPLAHRTTRAAAVALSYLCAFVGLLPAAAPAARAAARRAAPALAADTSFVRRLSLNAKDLVADPNTQTLYASVPSSAGAGGNSITPVDPVAGTIGTPVFVGSEPGRMAISDDGQYIYVALDGALAVRRFDVATQTADLQFSLGSVAFDGPLSLRSMAVQPGSPTALAVFRGTSFSSTSVAVYDNGVARASTVSSFDNLSLAFSTSDPTRLYGFGGGSLRRMTVAPAGVTQVSTAQLSAGGSIRYDAGRLYFSTGKVVNPESGELLGTFTVPDVSTTTPFVTDSKSNRVFFLTAPSSSFGSTATLTLRAFDQQTFLPTGTLELPGVAGSPTSLVRWGANGLAFGTSAGEFYLIQTTLVPSADPVPTPTPTPSPTTTPTPTPVPTPAPGELRQVALVTNDLVVDPNTQTLYASVPSSVGAGGNSITPVDPVAGTAGTPVFIGSEPNKLAISDNGQYIYAALDGALAVRRFDVATRTATNLQFSLGTDSFFGPLGVEDMEVAPGQPGTVAVSRKRNGVSPRHGGVAVYDDGVQRATVTPDHTGSNDIAFSNSPTVLYGQNTETTEFGFRRMAVAPCGVVTTSTVQNLLSSTFSTNFFRVANNIAYAVSGRVADPETGTLLGTFPVLSPGTTFPTTPALVAPDPKAGRVYFLVNESGYSLRVFDIKTFLKLGELRLPGVSGTASSLVRWGANGLAFRSSSGQVYLLQHALVGGTDPSFTPAAALPAQTMSAAGRVTSFNGAADGVTLSVTGSLTTTVTSDAGGNFTLAGVPPCGSFTVTPSKPNYSFNPASVTVTNPGNAAGQLNFTATLKTVGFQQATASVSEGSGRVSIFVTRNVSADPMSVSYETSSGTASDRSDFNTTLGTLQFGPSDTAKSISVLLTDDALVEGPETFTITLKDPTGAVLAAGASTVTITISDNDTAATAASPLTDARFFVARHYQDFLNRNAADDPVGFDFWTKQITDCAGLADAQARGDCYEDHRINVSAAFFLSIEFKETGYLVHRLYTASFPDSPLRPKGLPGFKEFLRDTQEMQRGVVVGQGTWAQQLEANKQAFVLSFVRRPEFVAAQPESLTADDFVGRLFANAGTTPTDAERAAAVAAFGGGGAAGRAAALRSVAESASVTARQLNSGFVMMQYFGYLRRSPNELPDADFAGYQFWLDKLNQFGDFRSAEMVKAFLVSLEYQQRFGPTAFDIRR